MVILGVGHGGGSAGNVKNSGGGLTLSNNPTEASFTAEIHGQYRYDLRRSKSVLNSQFVAGGTVISFVLVLVKDSLNHKLKFQHLMI